MNNKEIEFEHIKETAFWAGRLMGYDQDWEIAKEIVESIEYAEKPLQQENEQIGKRITVVTEIAREQKARIKELEEGIQRVIPIVYAIQEEKGISEDTTDEITYFQSLLKR